MAWRESPRAKGVRNPAPWESQMSQQAGPLVLRARNSQDGARDSFRVPNRGSGNPTPLGGWMAASSVDWLDGSVQARRPYGLGLQVSLGLGDEVSLRGAWRRRWGSLSRTAARDGAGA